MPALRKALALDPRFAEAQYVLGLCLRDARQYTDAEAALKRAIDLSPRSFPRAKSSPSCTDVSAAATSA